MATTPTLVTGDDILLAIELTRKAYGAAVATTFVITPTAIITARLVSTERETVYTPEITQVTAHASADLANSLIIIIFTSAQTIAIRHQGAAYLEVQIDDGGKKTWFAPVKLIRGQVD